MKKTQDSTKNIQVYIFALTLIGTIIMVVVGLVFNIILSFEALPTTITLSKTNKQTISRPALEKIQTTSNDDWQKFENSLVGFELRYPLEWKSIDAGKAKFLFVSPDLEYEGQILVRGAQIWLFQRSNPNSLSLEEIVDREKLHMQSSFVSRELILNNNTKAVALFRNDELTIVFVEKTVDKYLQIGLNYAEQQRKQEFQYIFNNLINSLRVKTL